MTTEATTTDAPNTTESATTQPATNAPATVADAGSQAAPAVEAKPAQNEPAAPQGAPESYAFVAPEGQTFDDSIIGAYSEAAKALDLPQDKAQKMLDMVTPAIAARQAEQLETAKAEWLEAAKTDTEFGGEKLTENLAFVAKARDDLATPELRALLDQTGLGNHPEMIRMFYRYGKAISEDSFTPGRMHGAATVEKSIAQRMYPNMNP